MGEKLIIKNFGPIKSVELNLGRFNVLIGEQATGKSTVAKVLAVCRYFSYIVSSSDEDYDHSFNYGLEAWGLSESIKEDSHIRYECTNYILIGTIKEGNRVGFRKGSNVLIPKFKTEIHSLSREFENLLNELEKLKPEPSEPPINVGFSTVKGWRIPASFFKNDVAAVMDNPFYLPAERGLQSIFSLGRSSIQNISDSLFNQFARLDQIARFFRKDTPIEPLNITYKNVDGEGFIRKNNEEAFYSLYNAASGYQSTIPVILLNKYYNEIRKKQKTFIIEEPELNLFPAAQQKLAEYLAETTTSYGNSIFLTTHSPYILTSLNNLIYAYNIAQTHKAEIEAVIDKKYWLNPEEVSVYMMLPDGTCEDIFDREEILISSEKIDGVSRIINEQFDRMLNIEFGITKEHV